MAGTGVRLRQRQRQRMQLFSQLQDSNRRFAQVMGTLMAKYDRPFKEDKLVHIATLTYLSSDGLKEWGGKKVTQKIFQNIQASLEKEGYNIDNFMQSIFSDATSSGVTLVARNDTSLQNEDLGLGSLPENDLDKKHITRVDVILEDEHPRLIMFDSFSKRTDQSLPMILSAGESSKALLDHSSDGPRENDGLSVRPTSGLQCPQGAPGVAGGPSHSLLVWRAWRSGLSGSTGDMNWSADKPRQELTLSDIYAEMLCSLSKCLPSQKVGLVSTNKYISKGWFPKKRRLNVTLTMESSFLKISRNFNLVPGRTRGIISRNPKQNFLPPTELAASPLGLKGALHNLAIRDSPSRTMDVSQASSPRCCSPPGTQPPQTPALALPPVLTSAKEGLHLVREGAPARNRVWQERGLPRSLSSPKLLQTPTSAPRLCREHSASDGPSTCPAPVLPREKMAKARRALPFGMEQAPCKGQDPFDSMFDTYSQETAQWAQELLFLKKSRQKSKEPTQSKLRGSLPEFSPDAGPQEPQKEASPQSIRDSPCRIVTPLHCTASPWSTRDSLEKVTPLHNTTSPRSSTRNSPCGTISPLHCAASPRTTSKGDFASPPKRRKLSSSQTRDCFSSSKMEDKVAPDLHGLPTDLRDSPGGRLRSSRVAGAQPLRQ